MNKDQLKQMGENGYDLVREKYTWDAVAKQMIELYEWISGNTKMPAFIRLN